jgi:copper chaperone
MIPYRGIETRRIAMSQTIIYSVPDVSCGHCAAAITAEVETVEGVQSVAVDLDDKTVTVTAEPLDAPAIVAAIDDAGYTVAA